MLTLRYEKNKYDKHKTDLVIDYEGKQIDRYSDGGEPEDNMFCRDWSWVKDAIESAYKLGLSNGELEGMRKAKKLIQGHSL